MRVDITAAACAHASTTSAGESGAVHCGTSYATPMVAGLLAAMLSIYPQLQPEQLRIDRNSVVYGKSVSVRVYLGACRIIKQNTNDNNFIIFYQFHHIHV